MTDDTYATMRRLQEDYDRDDYGNCNICGFPTAIAASDHFDCFIASLTEDAGVIINDKRIIHERDGTYTLEFMAEAE